MAAMLRARGWQRSLQLLDMMSNEALQVALMALNSCLAVASRRSQWQLACLLGLGALRPYGDVVTFNSLMNSKSRWPASMQIFEELRWQGLVPDAVSHTATFTMTDMTDMTDGTADHWPMALQNFQRLQDSGIAQDVVSCSASINLCRVANLWPLALEIFDAMLRARTEPNLISYNSLISCCETGLQWERACWILHATHAMPAMRADVVTYSAVLSCCEKSSQWQLALHTWKLLQDGASANLISYNSAISACGKGLQWQLALHFFQHLEGSRLSPDTISYNAVISSQKWQMALQLFEEMSPLAVVSVVTLGALLSTCEAQWTIALELLEAALRGLSPNVVIFNAAISSCEKASEWPAALAIFGMMRESNVEADVITYNALMSSCEKGLQWQLAMHLFSLVPQPTAISYNAVISACARVGDQWWMALRWLERMSQQQVLPTVISYNAAMSACEKSLQWQMVLRLLQQMSVVDLSPDEISGHGRVLDGGWVKHLSATKLEIKANDEGNMLFKVAKIGRVYPGGC